GVMRPGMKIKFMQKGQEYQVEQVGVFSPKPVPVDELGAGEVGFVFAAIKTVSDAQIGDTITEAANPTSEPFPGFKEMKSMVFAGLYPVEGSEYPELRGARLRLPLRVPRAAPHGNRPGAARARVQRRPDHHGAGRLVSRDDDRRGRHRNRHAREASRRGTDREDRRAGDYL